MANTNMPSMAALLGLVAVAGWQNRDKISSFVNGLTGTSGGVAGAATAAAANAQIPGGVSGALSGLINHMHANGAGDIASSWVGTGQNMPVNGAQLTQILGPDLVNKISSTTGLTPDQIVSQLSTVLPQVIDHLTPHGKVSPA